MRACDTSRSTKIEMPPAGPPDSIGVRRERACVIRHPVDIRVARLAENGMVDIIAVHCKNLSRFFLRHAADPFMNFGMSVGERKAARAVVVRARNINEFGPMRVEKSGVIDAVRVLVHEYPSPRSAWV